MIESLGVACVNFTYDEPIDYEVIPLLELKVKISLI